MSKQHHSNNSSVSRKRSENNEWSLERAENSQPFHPFLNSPTAEGVLTDPRMALGVQKVKQNNILNHSLS